LCVRVRAMPVEDDLEPAFAGFGNDGVHDLRSTQALQARILLQIDPVGLTGWIEQLIAVRQSDGVEAAGDDLVEHVAERASPQAMGCKRVRLEAKPVDARDAHFLAVEVDEFGALRVKRRHWRSRGGDGLRL